MFLAHLLLETQWVSHCSLWTLGIMKPLTLMSAELAVYFPPSQPPERSPPRSCLSVRLSGMPKAGAWGSVPGSAVRESSACREFINNKPH